MDSEQEIIDGIEAEILNALDDLGESIQEPIIEDNEPLTETEDTSPEPEEPAILAGDRDGLTDDMPLEFNGTIDPKMLKAFFQGIGCTVDEVKVNLTCSGWNVKTVDPAHVCMSELTLNKSAWLNYKCLGYGNVGMDVDKVLEVIKAAKKGDSINIKLTEDKIVMSAGIIVRDMKPVDTTGMSEPKVPNLNLPGHFTLNQDYLATALDQCGNVSDHVTIEAMPEGIKLSAQGDTDGAKADIPKEYLAFIQVKEAVMSKFPLDYLMTLAKASRFGLLLKGQDLIVSMGNDYPIKIEAGTKDWEITYLLAPRIDEE